jgi:hypothetical protein
MRLLKLNTIGVLILSIFVYTLAEDFPKIKYSKSLEIILNTSSTGANVKKDYKDLAVLIRLDNSNFDFDVIKEDLAGNISFSTSDGSFLPYQIKNWDTSNKIAEIWIIVPMVYGNNGSQFITLSCGKNIESISDEKIKEKIKLKEDHEISKATSLNTDYSLFKSSYDLYGVWHSNDNEGFIITSGEYDFEAIQKCKKGNQSF